MGKQNLKISYELISVERLKKYWIFSRPKYEIAFKFEGRIYRERIEHWNMLEMDIRNKILDTIKDILNLRALIQEQIKLKGRFKGKFDDTIDEGVLCAPLDKISLSEDVRK